MKSSTRLPAASMNFRQIARSAFQAAPTPSGLILNHLVIPNTDGRKAHLSSFGRGWNAVRIISLGREETGTDPEYQDGWGPWTDDAHADPQHGSRSPVHGSTRGCTSLTPPKLTNLMMGSATETSIVARWGLPPLPLGLVNFNLRYRPEGVPDGWVDVLNNEGMTVLNGTEKVVMRLLCSAGYKFQIRAAGNGGIYSLDYGEWSDQVDGSTARCSKLGKPVVDVIPLPERWGELRWKGIRFADRYIVEVRKQPEGGKGWDMEGDWVIPRQHIHPAKTTFRFFLDTFFNGTGIADAPNAYQFRIMAVDDGTNAIPSSDYSDFVIVIDTPISAVNGHSPGSGANDGRALLTRQDVDHEDILGSHYAGGAYEYRYRRLANSPGHHTGLNWDPDNPVEVTTTRSNPITGLQREEIYGIQLIYTVTRAGKTARVFAARDAYVWPSNSPPDDGDRVATIPLNYSRNDMTYSYRICEGTFSSNRERAEGLERHDCTCSRPMGTGPSPIRHDDTGDQR